VTRTKMALAGAATALIGGAAAYYLYERNTERPDYDTLREEGRFSLRAYPELTTASVTLTGSRDKALRRGFQRLADYIFAKDRAGDQIAMTAPVLQEEGGSPETWRVRFVMPKDRAAEGLPTPATGVAIDTIPARRVAAVRFPGSGKSADLRRNEDALRRWMEKEGLQPVGRFEYAFYNSPFVPPFLRRNEVIVPVAG